MSKNLLFTTSTELIRVPADSIVFISADWEFVLDILMDSTKVITKRLPPIYGTLLIQNSQTGR